MIDSNNSSPKSAFGIADAIERVPRLRLGYKSYGEKTQ
jgi:hypothetical protein